MSTRIHPRGICPCLREECARARRLENLRTIAWSMVALIGIFCSLWAVALLQP